VHGLFRHLVSLTGARGRKIPGGQVSFEWEFRIMKKKIMTDVSETDEKDRERFEERDSTRESRRTLYFIP
jgi:hypothetical protein